MLRYTFCALLLLILAMGCAKEVPAPEQTAPVSRPSAAPASSSATLPAVTMEASTSGKSALGRLGLMSEAPAGMCWLNMNEVSPDSDLLKLLAPNPAETSLQALAIAVNCQQLQNWRADKSQRLANYIIIAQKMDERVGGGGANQAKERWVMVQALGGNFGFFPQDQYTRQSYLTSEADKLPADGFRQLGEVRRDDMALYTVGLVRHGAAAELILTQYSQLRGTPVALVWHKPLAQVESLSKEILSASAYLAALIRQSDDPRLAGTAPAPAVTPPTTAEPASPVSPAPGQTPIDQGQDTAEAMIGGPAPATSGGKDITGWQKAIFGITVAQLRESYTLANPLREDLHGKAFYLDGSTEKIGGLPFRVLFDFSDSPMGPQRLGRIIFTNTTTGGSVAEHKAAILADLNQRFGQPTSDTSSNGGPVIWDSASGKASLQMMSDSSRTVWLVVLEAKKK